MDLLALTPLLVVWAVVGVALTVIDLREHRLPNALTLPLLGLVPAGLALADLLDVSQPRPWSGWRGAAAGAVLWLGVLGLIWLLSRGRGMGLGDVKLAPSIGATLGWVGVESALVGLFIAFVLGGAVSALLLVARRVDRRSAIPFGPFLLVGGAGAVLLAAWP